MGYDAAANAVSNGIKPGEWLFSESNYIHTRDSGKLKNATAQAGTSPDVNLTASQIIGLPVRWVSSKLYRFATAAEVTAATIAIDEKWGFIISGEPTGALDNDVVTGTEYAILVRGPAIINSDLMPVNDPYGGAFVKADYILLCEALNIATKPSPTTTTVQVNQ
jgi:hypothetical protein